MQAAAPRFLDFLALADVLRLRAASRWWRGLVREREAVAHSAAREFGRAARAAKLADCLAARIVAMTPTPREGAPHPAASAALRVYERAAGEFARCKARYARQLRELLRPGGAGELEGLAWRLEVLGVLPDAVAELIDAPQAFSSACAAGGPGAVALADWVRRACGGRLAWGDAMRLAAKNPPILARLLELPALVAGTALRPEDVEWLSRAIAPPPANLEAEPLWWWAGAAKAAGADGQVGAFGRLSGLPGGGGVDAAAGLAFPAACAAGRLGFAQLLAALPLPTDLASRGNFKAFRLACGAGQLGAAAWLFSLGMTREDARGFGCEAYHRAAGRRHRHVADWLAAIGAAPHAAYPAR